MLSGSCLCGGLVYEVDVASGPIVRLRLGCLDTPIGDRPKARIWHSDAAPWFDPKDQIPELPRGLDAR